MDFESLPPVDFGFGVRVTRDDVAADLARVRAGLEALQGKLNAGIIGTAGRAAGFTAKMQRTAAEQIGGTLADISARVAELQRPIALPIIGDLASTAQRSERFGAWPFGPEDGLPPASVLEARAALPKQIAPIPPAPDGGALVVDSGTFQRAVADFTSNILPLRQNDFQNYGPALELFEQRFPSGSRFLDLWRSNLSALESQTPIGVSAASSPAGAGGFISRELQEKLSSTPADGGFESPPYIPAGAGPGKTAPTGAPAPPKGPPTGPTGGSGAPCPPSSADPAGTWRMKASEGWRCVAPWYPGAPTPPGGAFGIGRIIDDLPGGSGNCSALCFIGFAGGGSPIPIPPTTPAPPLPVPPGGPCPTPAPCPEPACIQICGLDDLIAALKKPCPDQKEFTLWKSADTDRCYVLPKDQSPNDPGDIRLITGSNPGTFVEAAIAKCCEKKDEKEPDKPGEGGFPGAPVQLCDWILPANVTDFSGLKDPLGFLFGIVDADGNPIYPGGKSAPTGIVGTFWKYGIDALKNFWKGPWDALGEILKGSNCGSGAYLGQRLSIGFYNLLGGIFGDALEPLKIPMKQQSDFLCPLLMPGITEATQAYLANTIDEKTWRCWVRAANGRDDLFSAVMKAQRSRLSPGQIVSLRMREKIDDAQAQNRLRELGFIEPGDFPEVMELSKYIPGPQDTVRFMLRDVEDQKIVSRFGLDSEFKDKYTGKLKDFAKAQGVDDDTMLRYWRAHWSIPSPTQLYEMYHRLRNKPQGDPTAVTIDDIKTALQQQDILPFWIDKLLAVSFRPMRQVDVRNAYFAGVIDKQAVRESFEDAGFSDRHARILTAHVEKQKTRYYVSSPEVKRYANGEISAAELDSTLSARGADPVDVQESLSAGLKIASSNSRKLCVSAIRRRFLLSEFDRNEAVSRLISQGVDVDVANHLASGWQCQLESQGKHFSAAQLCKMLERGIIGSVEFVQRLQRAGWSREDAVKLYWVCSSDIDTRRRKEELARLKGEEQQRDKLRRESEKAARQLQQASERAAREVKRLHDSNRARESALIQAGERWARMTSAELAPSILRARALYRTLRAQTPYPVDEILRAIGTAAKDPDTAERGDFEDSALRVLESSQITE